MMQLQLFMKKIFSFESNNGRLIMIKHTLLLIAFVMAFNSSFAVSNDNHGALDEKQAYSWEIKDRLEQFGTPDKELNSYNFAIPSMGSLFFENKAMFDDFGSISQYRSFTRISDSFFVRSLSTSRDLRTNKYFLINNKTNNHFCIDVIYFPSQLFSQRTLALCEEGRLHTPPILPPLLPPMASPPPPQRPVPVTYDYPSLRQRPFYFLSWNDERIGDISFGDRLWGNPENRLYGVVFIRGNTLVRVFCINDPGLRFEGTKDENLMKQSLVPDPREIAWELDQYLKGDPLEKFSDDEKTNLKTLAITLPDELEFEQGVEYALDFPRKLPDGTVPAEIRLVVSRGEIQQVLDKAAVEDPNVFPNPASLAPDIDGKYTVLFGQPDKQTVHCYHINEEGKCLAWGEIEVFVKEPENPKSE